MKSAILVGGAFDMTKMKLLSAPREITMFEPLDPEQWCYHKQEVTEVDCRILVYNRVFETNQGTVIYEFARVSK